MMEIPATFGFGTMYGSDQVASVFIHQGVACIGHSYQSAAALYALMDTIGNGDIIFLKSYSPKTGLGIKAIGVCTDSDIEPKYDEDGESVGNGIDVDWVWTNEDDETLIVGKVNDKWNHCRMGALYQEFGPKVIHKLKLKYLR